MFSTCYLWYFLIDKFDLEEMHLHLSDDGVDGTDDGVDGTDDYSESKKKLGGWMELQVETRNPLGYISVF